MTTERRYKRGSSLAWPIILIGIGVVFLLNNMNVIDVDLWEMMTKLWPLVLVAVGLDILFGRRTGIWQGLTVLIIASLFATGMWFVRDSSNFKSGSLIKQEFSQNLEDAERASVEIDFGVGSLRINPLSDDSILASGEISLANGEVLDQDFQMVSETAYFQMKSHGPEFYTSWPFNSPMDGRIWQINLNDSIPLELDVNTGVGQSIIDLRGMLITDLDVDTGVGEVIVYLPSSGDFKANISAGIGKLTIKVPAGLAIRLHLDTGLGNHRVSGDFEQQDGYYFTDNYYSADERVDLYVDGGIGEIVVNIVD